MTLKQLEYFMEVANNLSFSEASKKLFISQPALSRSIVSLENELGVSLFTRNRQGVSLTSAGELLAAKLPTLQNELHQLMLSVRQVKSGLIGHLNIGMLEGQQMPERLRAALDHFAKNLPFVEISLLRLGEEELLDRLERGALDLVFSLDHGLDELKNVRYMQLEPVSYCMLVPLNHRLADEKTARLSDFATDTFIFTGEGRTTPETRFLLDCCARAGIQPRSRYVANTQTGQLWSEAGFGVSLFNARHRACMSQDARAIPIVDLPERHMALAWKSISRNPCIQLFNHAVEGGC